MEEKQFVTFDIYLSTAVSILIKIYPNFIVQNGKTLFVFPQSASLFQAISDYSSGIHLNISEYVTVFKKLKVEMITRRGIEAQK